MEKSEPRAAKTLLVDAQHRKKCLLRDIHPPYALHAALTLFLFFKQLALARDVASIALGQHVLSDGRHSFAGDHLAADRGLDGDLEHLAWNEFFHLGGQCAAAVVGEIAV